MPRQRDLWSWAGIWIVGATAAVWSFSSLSNLADLVGVTDTIAAFGVTAHISWGLPITVDVLAVVASRVWLRGTAPADAVRYAQRAAWAAIAASVIGNAYHGWLAGDGRFDSVIVSAVPAFVIGALVHLAVLATRTGTAEDPVGLAGQATVADLIAAQEEDPDSGVIISNSSVQTCVYRLVDAAGQLLYVGVTSNLAKRLQVHRASRSWWSDVAEVLIEDYPDRAAALAVEQSAIANEKPIYNVSNGGLRDRVGGADDPQARVDRTAYALDSRLSEADADDNESADEVAEVRLRRLIPVPATENGIRPPSAVRVAELAQDPSARSRVRDIVTEKRGRATVMREFDLSEHQARQLLKAVQGDDPVAVNGHTP